MANRDRQIFINLPVKDLKATTKFWSALGFDFNEQFTDENATAMIIGPNIAAMLIVEDFFKGFTPKEIGDTSRYTEVINSLTANSREEVDEFMRKALAAGATEPREPQEMEFMYGRSFQDLDGHLWEIFFMDVGAIPENAAQVAAEPHKVGA